MTCEVCKGVIISVTFIPVVQYLRSKMMPAFAVLIAVTEKKCEVKFLLILGQSLVSWMVYMVPYSLSDCLPSTSDMVSGLKAFISAS